MANNTKTFRIPDTQDAALTKLEGIESAILSKEWERAAIVAAYVRLEALPGDRFHSPRSFSLLRIPGLSTAQSVKRAVQAWLYESSGDHPVPGEEVEYPTNPYPTIADLAERFSPRTPPPAPAWQWDEEHSRVIYSATAGPDQHRAAEALLKASIPELRERLARMEAALQGYEEHPELTQAGAGESVAA